MKTVIDRMDTPKYVETLRVTNRFKQINDTLFRQRITAGSGTDHLFLRLSTGSKWLALIKCSGYTIIKPLARLYKDRLVLYIQKFKCLTIFWGIHSSHNPHTRDFFLDPMPLKFQ